LLKISHLSSKDLRGTGYFAKKDLRETWHFGKKDLRETCFIVIFATTNQGNNGKTYIQA